MGIHRLGNVALIVMALLTAGCGTGSDVTDEPRLRVVATTTVLGDVVENIVGDDATVEVLTPVGADPHDFQASAAQVALINQADLVVANGLGLEEGLEDVLEAAAADGALVLEVAPLVDPIPFGFETEHEDEADHEEHEDEADHGGDDPHVWLDPLRMADAASLIAERLAEIDSEIDWSSRAEQYAAALAAADVEIADILSSIQVRLLVTNHDSLGYFADRYGFEVVGVVIPGGSTLGDPSSGALADLIEVMQHEGVRVIFGETTQPGALAEAIAAELGDDVRIVSLYTGSIGEPGSGADTLVGMLQTNAERIAEALAR